MTALPFESWGLSIGATDGFEGITHPHTLSAWMLRMRQINEFSTRSPSCLSVMPVSLLPVQEDMLGSTSCLPFAMKEEVKSTQMSSVSSSNKMANRESVDIWKET